MTQSADGFNRPVLEGMLNPEDDARIATVCPGLGVAAQTRKMRNPLWGHILALRTGHAGDRALRFKASSGGALSAILIHLLEANIADFVVHTEADPDDPVSNVTRSSETAEDVANAAGSRYAPSSPLADIQRHLATGCRFAFVGKPCDVAALRAMARLDPRIDAQIVCMISFFCAGVPARHGAMQILKRMGVRLHFLRAFRYRGHGWPGSATAILKDGTQRQLNYRESWGDILSKQVQFRCKICADGTGEAADIVCADAWQGDAKGYPRFEEADGRSLILSRTARGEAIVQAARRAGVLSARHLEESMLERMQPGQASRMRVLFARLAALWITAQPRPIYRGFALRRAAGRASALELVRNFLGTGRRVLMGRR